MLFNSGKTHCQAAAAFPDYRFPSISQALLSGIRLFVRDYDMKTNRFEPFRIQKQMVKQVCLCVPKAGERIWNAFSSMEVLV